MNKQKQKEIQDSAKEIQIIRKNPLLILNLEDVRGTDLLILHKLLHGKTFDILDVILQTAGGDIDAAYLYAKLLRKSAPQLNIIIPLYSKSAGTLICLVADELLMTELSELGPLDTQIRETKDGDSPGYASALNGFKALEQIQKHNVETLDIVTQIILKKSGMKISEAIHLATEFCGQTSASLYKHLNPNKIGEYARALEIGVKYGNIILDRFKHYNKENAERIIDKLVYGYPSHGFAIDCEELQKLGLPAKFVSAAEAEKIFSLRNLLLRCDETFIDLMEVDASGATAPKTIPAPKKTNNPSK